MSAKDANAQTGARKRAHDDRDIINAYVEGADVDDKVLTDSMKDELARDGVTNLDEDSDENREYDSDEKAADKFWQSDDDAYSGGDVDEEGPSSSSPVSDDNVPKFWRAHMHHDKFHHVRKVARVSTCAPPPPPRQSAPTPPPPPQPVAAAVRAASAAKAEERGDTAALLSRAILARNYFDFVGQVTNALPKIPNNEHGKKIEAVLRYSCGIMPWTFAAKQSKCKGICMMCQQESMLAWDVFADAKQSWSLGSCDRQCCNEYMWLVEVRELVKEGIELAMEAFASEDDRKLAVQEFVKQLNLELVVAKTLFAK